MDYVGVEKTPFGPSSRKHCYFDLLRGRREPEDYRKPYVYTPIAENEIRLFDLLPAKHFGARLEGTLYKMHIPLRRPSPWSCFAYEALSYTWGPTYEDGSHLTQGIICDGRTFRVTSNVELALRHLRAGNAGRSRQHHRKDGSKEARVHRFSDTGSQPGPYINLPIWIDAICINQADPAERSAQVAHMHHIFQYAAAVTVWLGEPAADVKGDAQINLFASGVGDKATVESLLDLPWFHRRWVIQEVSSCSNNYAVRLGPWECSYGRLYDFIRSHDLVARAGPMWLRTKPLSLLQALFIYRDSECSEPLDRIYALRNIASDGSRLPVNYDLGVRDVYKDLAWAVAAEAEHEVDDRGDSNACSIRTRQFTSEALPSPASRRFSPFANVRPIEMLRLLALATCFKSPATRSRDATLESWVPDWREKAVFDSIHHREAVETCVANDCILDDRLNSRDLPDGVIVTESGLTLLHVPGGTLCLPAVMHDTTLELRNELEGSVRLCVHTEFPTVGEDSLIWLPWLGPLNRTPLASLLARGVGFVVCPGLKHSVYEGRPVYRLHSCFLLKKALRVAHFNLWIAADVAPPVLSGSGVLEHDFYLE